MPNVFDQFDAQSSSGNVFDQFDESRPTQQPSVTQPEQSSTVADIAKSAGVGLAKGAVGLAGIPGDVSDLMSLFGNWVGDKLGLKPLTPEAAAQLGHRALTSAEIQKGIEGFTGEFYKPQTTAGEYAQTIGEFAPAIIGGPESIATRAATRTVIPAVASETAGQLTSGTEAEPYARLAGALLGAGAGAGTASKYIIPEASPERAAAVKALESEGVTSLTAGQRTGSKPLKWIESSLSDVPFSGRGAEKAAEKAREQFTSAVLKRAGTDAQRATTDVIDNSFSRIGGEFDRIAAGYNAEITPAVWNRMQDTLHQYLSVTPPAMRAPIVENLVDNIGEAAINNQGLFPGKAYQSLRSQIDRSMRGAKPNVQLTDALRGLKEAVDTAMERSISKAGVPEDVNAWRTARRQYRNMMVIEKAATAPGEDAALGLISPAQLRQAVVAQSRRAYARGQGEFAGLARSGEAIMRPLPQSGTSPRGYALHMAHQLGRMLTGSFAAAATLGGVPISGRILMSGPVQKYLANQVLTGATQSDMQKVLRNLALAHPSMSPSTQESGYAKGGKINNGSSYKGRADASNGNQVSIRGNMPMDIGGPDREDHAELKQLPSHEVMTSQYRTGFQGGGVTDLATASDAQFGPEMPPTAVPQPTPPQRSFISKLGETWPARIVTDAASALKGIMTEDYVPGQRREAYTDIPPPQAPTADSTMVGRALGIAPVAWQPNQEYIGQAADLAQLLTRGGSFIAPRGALGVAGGKMIQPGAAQAVAPAFYSAVERAVETSPQASAPSWQWLGMLKNKPGVKPEELEWLGLPEWLKSQEGPISRDAVRDYLKANQVEVQEVTKGARAPLRDLDDLSNDRFGIPYEQLTNSQKAELQSDLWNRESSAPAKFSEYTLPGGENYRELLLTMPSKEPISFEEFLKREGYTSEELANPERMEKARRGYENVVAHGGARPDDYRSSHWDEPNVLAHVRFNDRDINGQKTLFLEELQSDWHQQGRKTGYAGDEIDLKRQLADLTKEYETATPDRRLELLDEMNVLHDKISYAQRGVPDAPFKSTWPDLVMKRMIRYAADNGYDRIAWTNGATQAERYDLSKQVEAIVAKKAGDQVNIKAILPGARSEDLGTHTLEKLPDVIGKDLAEKIAGQRDSQKRYEGIDLKVGGEGMKAFYDREMPQRVNKLVKKFGARVQPVRMFEGNINEWKPFQRNDGSWGLRSDDGYESSLSFASRGEAASELTAGESHDVHSFAITPELRKVATEQGFPMFKRGGRIH